MFLICYGKICICRGENRWVLVVCGFKWPSSLLRSISLKLHRREPCPRKPLADRVLPYIHPDMDISQGENKGEKGIPEKVHELFLFFLLPLLRVHEILLSLIRAQVWKRHGFLRTLLSVPGRIRACTVLGTLCP